MKSPAQIICARSVDFVLEERADSFLVILDRIPVDFVSNLEW